MIDRGPHIRAIGWLDDQHEFPVGQSPTPFVARLKQFTEKWDQSTIELSWGFFMGLHSCELCDSAHAAGNFGVPAGNLLFVAPEMIWHYVTQHDYLPPQPFIEAVENSPLPGTKEYAIAVAPFSELNQRRLNNAGE